MTRPKVAPNGAGRPFAASPIRLTQTPAEVNRGYKLQQPVPRSQGEVVLLEQGEQAPRPITPSCLAGWLTVTNTEYPCKQLEYAAS